MALAPVDLKALEQLAQRWISNNPTVNIMALPRGRRLIDEGARAAFAIQTKPANAEGPGLSPVPCIHCGLWSHAFCESCDTSEDTPTGLCSLCDKDHLTCLKCMANNKSWEAAVAQRSEIHSGEHIEVSGFEDDEGNWTPLRPAIRIPTADLVTQQDGTYSMQQIAQRIQTEMLNRKNP